VGLSMGRCCGGLVARRLPPGLLLWLAWLVSQLASWLELARLVTELEHRLSSQQNSNEPSRAKPLTSEFERVIEPQVFCPALLTTSNEHGEDGSIPLEGDSRHEWPVTRIRSPLAGSSALSILKSPRSPDRGAPFVPIRVGVRTHGLNSKTGLVRMSYATRATKRILHV